MKIYANIIKSGQIIKSSCIGVAILDDGRVSARKFNALKRSAMKEFPSIKKGQHMQLVTDDGKTCEFGGYPCPYPFVRFS